MHQMIQSTYHGACRQRRLSSRDLHSVRDVTFGMLQETTNQLWRISPEQGETLPPRAFLSTTGSLWRTDTAVGHITERSILFKRTKHEIER